jgi:hypothetical protein
MRRHLTVFAVFVLAAMLAVSAWATAQLPIGAAIRDVLEQPRAGTHPWFVATLFDTYFGFLWFWLWVAHRESALLARGLWLVLILALGNIAMAAYVLLQLRRLPEAATVKDLLVRSA